MLFDHFPDGCRVLGGAPFNVAWHLQAFGLSPSFISRIGDDPAGHEITALMYAWGMGRDAIQTDGEHPTGSVRVLIKNGEPHYEIVADCAYDFIAKELLKEKHTQGILYHGSLAVRNPVSLSALKATKARHQGKIFIDINLRPPWWDRASVLSLLHDADWVKLNEAELAALCPGYNGLETTMRAFCAQFDLDILVVTCGAKGAIAYDREQFLSVQPSKHFGSRYCWRGRRFRCAVTTGIDQAMAFRGDPRAGASVCQLFGWPTRRNRADTEFYRAFSEQWS